MSEPTFSADCPAWHDTPPDWLRARAWAQGLLARQNWVLLDTETTGLDGDAEPVQISVVAPDGETLFHTLLRPKAPIPAEAAAIHGITDAMVAAAPTFADAWPRLKVLLTDKTVVAYNSNFDARMLIQAARLHGTEYPEFVWSCAMEWYAIYVGEWSPWHGDYRWQRLPGASHGALGDCLATLAVIRRMAEGK